MAKVDAKRALSTCTPEHAFWACDGQIYCTLNELAKGLRRMRQATFSHHVTSERNDFATWISDVFDDPVLARQVQSVRTKATMAKRVRERVSGLKKR